MNEPHRAKSQTGRESPVPEEGITSGIGRGRWAVLNDEGGERRDMLGSVDDPSAQVAGSE